jgi:site-specific DNA-methyltransferase (adenine-specific)
MSAATAAARPLSPLACVTDRSVLRASNRNAMLLRADATALPIAHPIVDLTVTSPPYGLGVAYADGGDVPPVEWSAFTVAWMREVRRVTKLSGRLVVNVPLDTFKSGYRPIYKLALDAAEAAGWTLEHQLVWDEGNTTKGNRALGSVNSAARPRPVDTSEIIAIFSNGPWGPSSDNPDAITSEEWQAWGRGPWRFSGASAKRAGHPAPFPEELPRRAIKLFSRRGDVVLDPFVGSGTTVAVAEGRSGIGCDRSPTYLRIAARRIASVPLRLPTGQRCTICNDLLSEGRRDRTTCSSACRQRAYRQRRSAR